MILALALVLLAAPAGLDEARAAFARGDYAKASALAQAAARESDAAADRTRDRAPRASAAGAALYLAGLASFRAGDAQAALLLLDGAWHATDRPPEASFRFNRAACLYVLGRYREAEADDLAAAKLDEALAPVALLDAGFAALDGGSPARAAGLAKEAAAIAKGDAVALVADLQQHIRAEEKSRAAVAYRAALASFDAGDFAGARARFLEAAALDPEDGRARIMAGASSIQLGERARAREELELSLTLRLDDADAQIARDYLDSLSPLPLSRGFSAAARLSAGFDSNALQTGFLQPTEFPGETASNSPSAFTAAGLSLRYRAEPRARLFLEASYQFDQLAYFASAASDRSLQQNAVLLSLEGAPRDDLRLGLSLGGQLDFNGLSQFRGLQVAAISAAWASFDEGDHASTRLDLGYDRKDGLSEFGYLTGDRLDAALSQELRFALATLTLGYRFRAELIGAAEESVSEPPPPGLCPQMNCVQTLHDPFGYTSHTLWAGARAPLTSRLSFELSFGLELRAYTEDNWLTVSQPDGASMQVDRRRRHDDRWFGTAGLAFALTQSLSLSLRYDVVINRSDIDSNEGDGPPGQCGPPQFDCHQLDGEVRSYDKHVVTLGAAATW